MSGTTNLIVLLRNRSGPIAAHIRVKNGLIAVNGSNELKYQWVRGAFSTPPARYVPFHLVRFPRCRLVRGLENLRAPMTAPDVPDVGPSDVSNRLRMAAK